jgi:hypothetical protein
VLLVSMFMSSQLTRIFEKAHPTRFDENKAEAETGAWPSPPRLTAITKMNNRRIDVQSTKFPAGNIHLSTSFFFVAEAVSNITKQCDSGHGGFAMS